MNRTRAILLSLGLTVILNTLAGVLTLIYLNGTTIIETNPYASVLLEELGAATLLVHAIEIGVMYPLAYAVSMAISSRRHLLREKRIYLFTFSLLIAILPAAAFADLLSDVLVISFALNILVGYEKTLTMALAFAIPFAVLQVGRRWTLETSGLPQ